MPSSFLKTAGMAAEETEAREETASLGAIEFPVKEEDFNKKGL
jgi:hypothetical protein